MSVTIIATISGLTSNSYCLLSEAEAYFANRLWATDWSGATDDNKSRALIMAAQRIDQEYFLGTRTVAGQALKWPRWNVQIPGESYEYQYGYYATNVIPQLVKDAQCEYALLILGSDVLAQQSTQNFKSVKVGPIDVTFNQPVSSGILPDQVLRLLRGLRMNASRLVRA